MQFCRFIVVLFVFIVISIVSIYHLTYQVPSQITIATGSKMGAYYQYALKYKEDLKKEGLDINIVTTNGSLEALELLDKEKVDIAFVQGGTAKNYKNKELISLSSIFYEPLWIFYNKQIEVEFLSDLKNKKVSIGKEGSGTRALFKILLKENGLKNSELLNYSEQKAIDKLKKGTIDALCLVVSPQAPMIKELLNEKDIKLMSFNREMAYKDKFDYINSLTLNQGVIDLSTNIPHKNTKLLTTTASLVVKQNFNNDLQRLIIKTIKPIHKDGGIFEPKDYFPSINYVELPISTHTKSYLLNGDTWMEKYLPFWLCSLIEELLIILVPIIPLLIIFIKIILPSYSLHLKHKVYIYENKIRDIEKQLSIDKRYQTKNIIELRRDVKYNCFIYFFNTTTYYNLILKLDSILDNIEHIKQP